MEKLRKIINAALAVVVLSTALLVMAWMISTRPVPLRTSEGVRVPEVLTSQATPTVFDAPVVAYGTIQPKNQVKIIPQVSGMLVYAHPDLAPGKIIPAGETLFEIDPRAYESQVKQVEADIALLKVQRTQHQVQADHLRKRLDIANEQFELARKDLEREQGLLESGVSKAIEVDVARQKFLKFQDMVMGYQSQLAMIPHRIAETQARLDARQAQLADARRNLDSTKIVCPFNARVGTVLAKASQVVTAHLQIAALTDLSALELPAVLDPAEFQWTDRRAYARAIGGDLGEPPAVTVTWTLHDQQYSWAGQVTRLERHDEITRTARLVIEVPQSLEEVRSSEAVGKPALSIGMFCSAAIPAQPLADALVVPRSVIHEDNMIYVFEPDPNSVDGQIGRLALRQVPILRNVKDHVLVDFAGRQRDERLSNRLVSARCELKPGERIILSPLPRPVAGMTLRMRSGRATAAALDRLGDVAGPFVHPAKLVAGFVAQISSPPIVFDLNRAPIGAN